MPIGAYRWLGHTSYFWGRVVSDNYFFRRVLIVADQLRELITRYGRPRTIQFDDGSEFLAEHFKILFVSCYSVFILRHQRDEPGMNEQLFFTCLNFL